MTRRYVRLTFFVLLILALGAASWQIVLLERSLSETEVRADASAADGAAVLEALLDMRASERAFLAEGQGAPYWHERVGRALDRLREHLPAFRASASGRRDLFLSTDEALARLLKVEARIGDHALAGRRPHAEDLIFADALQASLAVERDVREAREVLAAAARQQVRAIRERELLIVALAAAVALLAALLLLPMARVSAAAETSHADAVPRGDDLPLNLRDAAPKPVAVEAASAAAVPARPKVTISERVLMARLSSAADLCTALSRVRDSRDLPSLLAHIARTLDAQGVIVWLADARERRLTPALAHGYRDIALARMGAITWDEQNPVAEVYRRRESRTIDAGPNAPAALVVPLVSVSDCAGVMTIELRAGDSKAGEPATLPAPDSTSLALARIFAAQLASLLTPAAEAAPPDAVRAAGTSSIHSGA